MMKMIRTLQNALKKYMLYKIENGSYKFFVQKLEAEPDINLASDLYSTDFFRHNLKPMPIDATQLHKVVVFAPHQDDESIGCGGILSRLHELGSEIHIVFLTDGENLSGEMANVRHTEAQDVSHKLGAKMHEIGISNVTLQVEAKHIYTIADLLALIQPDAIFATWPLDMPPIHRLCNVILGKALSKSGLDLNKLPIFSYQVHTALLPNMYFDYTLLFDKKQDLIGCYLSQIKEMNYQHLSAGLDAWSTRFLPGAPEKRFVELFSRLPANAYIDMIEHFYPKNLQQTFKGNDRCIASYNNLLQIRLDNE